MNRAIVLKRLWVLELELLGGDQRQSQANMPFTEEILLYGLTYEKGEGIPTRWRERGGQAAVKKF